MRNHPSSRLLRGFTLIELMIAVAIVAILASVALPAYRDYVMRGRVSDATQALSSRRAAMEQYYQDQRTYAPPTDTAISYPCASSFDTHPGGGTFIVKCNYDASGDKYTITAQGSGAADGFEYTIDENGSQVTTKAWDGQTGACWILRRGDTC